MRKYDKNCEIATRQNYVLCVTPQKYFFNICTEKKRKMTGSCITTAKKRENCVVSQPCVVKVCKKLQTFGLWNQVFHVTPKKKFFFYFICQEIRLGS